MPESKNRWVYQLQSFWDIHWTQYLHLTVYSSQSDVSELWISKNCLFWRCVMPQPLTAEGTSFIIRLHRCKSGTANSLITIMLSLLIHYKFIIALCILQVRLAANSCVTKDIHEPGDYGGFPAVRIVFLCFGGCSSSISESCFDRAKRFQFSWTAVSFTADANW